MKTTIKPTAIQPEGEGTEAKPYQITSINNLLWIGNEAEKYNTNGKFYQMMNDIDASETRYWQNGAGFRPIGQDYSHSFQGTFDGNNKTITGLYINSASNSGRLYVGLFGLTSHSTIKNLELKNVNISCAVSTDKFYLIDYIIPYVGGLAGLNCGAIINCTISGVTTVNGRCSDIYIGGLVGENYEGTITNCTASASVTSTSTDEKVTNIGGLVGENYYGTITNCTASASVTSTSTGGYRYAATHVGGLVGKNNGAIAFCTASGNVIGANISCMAHTHIGGLIGYNSNSSTITNCTALGNVESTNTGTDKNNCLKAYVGGLIGDNFAPITDCTALGNVTGVWLGETNQRNDSIFVGGLVGQNLRSKIDRCYSVGVVYSNYSTYVGGLVGDNAKGSVVRSFWDTNTSGQATSSGGIGKTTEKMKRWVTYSK